MPAPQVTPVRGDETLPSKVDVVVVGGGIVGTTTAMELAEQGLSVALCEKGGIGMEQSSRNWGWVKLSMRSPAELPLMMESYRIWTELSDRIGRDVGFRKYGSVITYRTKSELKNIETWCEIARDYAISTRMLSKTDIGEKLPGATLRAKGGFYTPGDAFAEPQKTAPAIAEFARERGAAILTDCAVRGLETSAGRVSAVVTERGVIACSAVVMAGGVWSNLFSHQYGINVPMAWNLNSVLRTAPIKNGPDIALWTKGFTLRKHQDDSYTISSGDELVVDLVPNAFRYFFRFLPGLKTEWKKLILRVNRRSFEEIGWMRGWKLDEVTPFEKHRVLDPKPVQRLIDRPLRNTIERYPALSGARIAQQWGGYIDVTPDGVPIISAIDSLPGYYVACGFSGHGFGMGPGGGRLMADIVSGRKPIVDPAPFRHSRYFDGTKIRPAAH